MSDEQTPEVSGEVQDGKDPIATALVKINVTRAVLDDLRRKAKERAEAEAKAAEAEKARLAALAPDKEKLTTWADGIEALARDFPSVSNPELVALGGRVQTALIGALTTLRGGLK